MDLTIIIAAVAVIVALVIGYALASAHSKKNAQSAASLILAEARA